jgi:hypothetical protein
MGKNSKSIDDQIAEFKELFEPPPVEEGSSANELHFANMADSLEGIPPFKAALIAYLQRPDLTTDHRAQLQRWAEDDRATEDWQIIIRALHDRELLLPANAFIREILAIKTVSEAIASRAKYRRWHRAQAKRMEELAKFLRKPHPLGMPPTFPRNVELAQILDNVAEAYRREVEPIQDVPGVVKVSRESDAPAIFMSQVSHYLKEITGRWLDPQVAVLTEIAFKDVGDVDVEQVERARRNRRRLAAVKAPV